jgi:molybdopterin-guanine dinucleotide biosynthesis protein MobB
MNLCCPPPNVIAIVGPSGSGKTALICRLVPWLQEKGLTVAVLKHSHRGRKITENRIALNYRRAGAKAVALTAPGLLQISLYGEEGADPASILTTLALQADVVLVEGFRQSPLSKLAFISPGRSPVALGNVVALLSRKKVKASPRPVFSPDEVDRIGAFILGFLNITEKTRR